jgi:hypothetical protein
MAQITIDLPDSLAKLPDAERESIIRAGLYEAIRARRREIEGEIQTAQMHIQQFEHQYGMPFARFESELLPTLDVHEAHEDYNDWFFWQSVLTERQHLLTGFSA